MFWSKTLIPTLKETPQEAESLSHQLLLRAGLIRMLMAGVYSYLPLGFRVLKHIEQLIRQEMDACGANEVLLPSLQPLELWLKSGRDKDIGEVMTRFVDRRGRKVCLGPTHEEVITDLVKNHIASYRQLPLVLYQLQTKFRDELRPRFGLIRASEFIMKDAYSFDRDEAGLDKNYKAMLESYKRIFKRCGLEVLVTEADPGVMGGNVSHEFMLPAQDGEDVILLCPQCQQARAFVRSTNELSPLAANAAKEAQKKCSHCGLDTKKVNTIELGHIFKLGTKYSSALGANFLDAQGKLQPIIMGCYGIGVSRMISGIIEANHDRQGIIWPKEITPYQVIILALDITDNKIKEEALGLYNALETEGFSVLLDDRDERSGVKFKDADLVGVPLQLIIGKQSLKEKKIELKLRRTGEKVIQGKAEIIEKVKGFYK